ncbi:MAG TPA: TetR/AcrR family transcriptional regulator [Spongiibacteraceae bacterium]|nr:TetR/AcrR family transcriptional regulator [Spongiibacteraceae bacterium]
MVKRSPGRPARISREAIIQKSMELLADIDVDDFMLKTVAEELGTVSMAIYNYFASREELLEAVADEVALLFKMPKPKPNQTWQENLLAWLWAFKKHAERYPVIYNVMNIEGHTTAGWFRVTAPVVKIMHDMGLRDKALAHASYLFCSSSTSLMYVESVSALYRKPKAFTHFERLSSEEQLMMMELQPHMAAITKKEVYDAIFDQVVRGVERFIPR